MEKMNRRRRTRVLVLGSADLRKAWAAAVRAKHHTEILDPPRAGLVMAEVREGARRSRFNLGEVLVTEAKVKVDGVTGLGMIRGWDEGAAEDLAAIDAACRAGFPVNGPWELRLTAEEADLTRKLGEERALLDTTKVDFETMDQEAPQ